MEKGAITGCDCTCRVAPSSCAVMDLTKCEQRKAGVDNERDDGMKERKGNVREGRRGRRYSNREALKLRPLSKNPHAHESLGFDFGIGVS